MSLKNETRRIYVADLAAYAAGKLHGEWIDADQDADDIRGAIADMLRKSPCPNTQTNCPDCDGAGGEDVGEADGPDICQTCHGTGEVPTAEEWAIHDYEGFGEIKLGEHPDLDTVAELAVALDEHGEPFAVWWANESRDGAEVDKFEEQYRGAWPSLADYAEDYLDSTGAFGDCNDMLRTYFDFERFASDMEMGGDVWTHDGEDGVYVFDNR